MNKRVRILLAIVAVASALSSVSKAAEANDRAELRSPATGLTIADSSVTEPGGADEQASLRETLEAGLKARRPVEFAFIDRVVRMVEENRLPLPLVLGTFQWARRQHPQYPFVYFERALRIRARKIGIRL